MRDSDDDHTITPNDDVGVWYVPHAATASGNSVLLSSQGELEWSGGDTGAWVQTATLARTAGDAATLLVGQTHRGGPSSIVTLGAEGVVASVNVEGAPSLSTQVVRMGAAGPMAIVWAGALTRVSNGSRLRRGPESETTSLAADLDGDGVVELIVAAEDGVHFVRNDAAANTVCQLATPRETFQPLLAIGQLDDDADGEVALLGGGAFAVCDGSGELLLWRDLGAQEGGVVAIAELDGDGGAEFVVGLDNNTGGAEPGTSVLALDGDATGIWEYPTLSPGRPPLSVADLDGDGVHEVLVHDHERLLILSHDGELLAEAPAPASMSSIAAPAIADLDGDDLAEIIVTGAEPTVAVYDAGGEGWPVREASQPWPGLGRHPGDRAIDGSVPSSSFAWWLQDGGNAWQGLPAGPALRPDLGVEIAGACADGHAEVALTIHAWNAGSGALEEPAVVSLYVGDGNASVAELRVEPPLGAGEALTWTAHLDARDVLQGLRATIAGVGDVRECGESPNEASWLP